jgi:Protein of unknown function (DUF3631)/Domain of unknown function (DUF3854)
MNVPETEHAIPYLLERGIRIETALEHGIEIQVGDSHSRGVWKQRLGFDQWGNKMLPDLVKEALWVSHKDAKGKIQSYSVRVFPTLRDTEGKDAKFLTPKDGNSYPFIPVATWEAAQKPNQALCLTEGPVKALAILQAGGLPIGLNGVWGATTKDDFGTDLHPILVDGFWWKGRKNYLVFDADYAENLSVRQALIRACVVMHKYGAEARVVRWRIDEGKGIDDYLAGKTGSSVPLPALFTEMRNAGVPLSEVLRYLDLEITELELIYARLRGSPLQQFCKLVTKPLLVSVSTLVEDVEQNRYKFISEAEESEPLPDVKPRPLPIILKEIRGILRRYVTFKLPEEQSIVIALWILHTWLFAAFDYTPYLYIFSASWRSGKSRLLETISFLCRNPELVGGASAAALLRMNSETNQPTFLIDELDTVFRKRADGDEIASFKQFVDSGYERGATFAKCVGQGTDIVVKKFPAFCPKAFASIGQCLSGQIVDRCIPIEIERQKRGQRATKLRKRELKVEVAPLRDELKVTSADEKLIEILNKDRPAMPDELNDRAEDVCEPLLAIADHIGGEWPKNARDALIKLFGDQDEEHDIGIRLLTDIKRVFDKRGADKLFTETLLEDLVEMADDAPWPAMFEELLKSHKAQTAGSRLAYHLKPYHIKPRTVWVKTNDGSEVTGKGYHRHQFEKVWERYLPDFSSSPPDSSRQAVRFSPKGHNENNLEPDGSPDSNPRPDGLPNLTKPLAASEISLIPDDLTAEKQNLEEKKLEEPQNPENELRLDEIREIFPNAEVIPPDEPDPPKAEPELPF